MKAPQRSLLNWGKQKWRTKSGKKSRVSVTYAALSDSGIALQPEQNERVRLKGKQFVAQPKKIANKVRRYRNA